MHSLDPTQSAPDTVSESPTRPDACDVGREAMGAIDGLQDRLDKLAEENMGMAEELLRSYGQLHLMFGVTQRSAGLHDAGAVVTSVMRDLGELLLAQEAWFFSGAPSELQSDASAWARVYLRRGSDGDLARRESWSPPPTDALESPELNEAIREASFERTMVWAVHARLMVVSVVGGGEHLGTAVFRRGASQDDIVSGEMLLAESVLGFAGHILLNIRLFENLKRMSVEVVRALVNAIDQKDHYTSGHSERVGFYACLIGRELNLSATEMEVLEWAGLLHDVGKIGVPDGILSKPGKLTDEEFAEIKKHPCMSYEVLKPIASFGKVLDGVHFHHENQDGSGYPKGMKGDEIPLFGRIIHVADVFDALTSTRSYRPAFSWDQAIKILRKEAGVKLDPEHVECLLRGLESLPPKTRLALQSVGSPTKPAKTEERKPRPGVGETPSRATDPNCDCGHSVHS